MLNEVRDSIVKWGLWQISGNSLNQREASAGQGLDTSIDLSTPIGKVNSDIIHHPA